MPCAECNAFVAAYHMATEHYAMVSQELHASASNGHFKSKKYSKLKGDVEKERVARQMAKTALPRSSGPSSPRLPVVGKVICD